MNPNVFYQKMKVLNTDREALKKQKGCVIWFTGFSGSGKSTLAQAIDVELFHMGLHSYLLDGDNIRCGLNQDLGFSYQDRHENIRRISEVARLFVDAGLIVCTAFISPFIKDREKARTLFQQGRFIEVYVNTPLDVCEERDPKGLYKKARAGMISDFTGIDSPYEAPMNPDVKLDTVTTSVEQATEQVISYLKQRDMIHTLGCVPFKRHHCLK